MEFEPDYSVDEPEAQGEQQQPEAEPSAEQEEPQTTEDGGTGGEEAGASLQSPQANGGGGGGGGGAAPPDTTPEEWQVNACGRALSQLWRAKRRLLGLRTFQQDRHPPAVAQRLALHLQPLHPTPSPVAR